MATSLKRDQEHQWVKKKHSRQALGGWFEKFKRRFSKRRHKGYRELLKKIANSKSYLQQQVFNCEKMGLFWKNILKELILQQMRRHWIAMILMNQWRAYPGTDHRRAYGDAFCVTARKYLVRGGGDNSLSRATNFQ